jgi:hypothetical protein
MPVDIRIMFGTYYIKGLVVWMFDLFLFLLVCCFFVYCLFVLFCFFYLCLNSSKGIKIAFLCKIFTSSQM